jgi:hypothetical protein
VEVSVILVAIVGMPWSSYIISNKGMEINNQ